jgi:hypothetical protein
VRAGLNELEAAGYYTRRKVRRSDGTIATITTVFEEPGLGSPSLGYPGPDEPALVGPGPSNEGTPMTEHQGEEETYVSPSPRSRALGRTNVVWDALTEHFGEPTTAPEKRRRGLTTKELREAGADAESIAAAVKRHKRIWPKVTCTERSIVAHWTELTKVNPVDAERDAHHARMKKAREESK